MVASENRNNDEKREGGAGRKGEERKRVRIRRMMSKDGVRGEAGRQREGRRGREGRYVTHHRLLAASLLLQNFYTMTTLKLPAGGIRSISEGS
jgi:hypothetical protein